jgi:hypothetical protein
MKKTVPQIAKNHDVKPYASLVVIVFIGLRDAYYIKLVSGATAAIRDNQSIFWLTCMHLSRAGFLEYAELSARLPLEMFYRLGDINISPADVCLFETLIQ